MPDNHHSEDCDGDEWDKPERPGPDADANEIAEWMEKYDEWAMVEGIRNALDGKDDDVASDEGDGP